MKVRLIYGLILVVFTEVEGILRGTRRHDKIFGWVLLWIRQRV